MTGAVDVAERALQLAYSHLDQRERTASEVREHLRRKGVDPATTDLTMALLTDEGSVDDRRYARMFTADKRHLEQWGAERIRRTLLQHGVDPEIASAALSEEADDVQPFQAELSRAVDLLRRRFSAPPQARRDRDRALGMLVRRGYEPEVALDALAAFARGE
jgi:regulatory protein